MKKKCFIAAFFLVVGMVVYGQPSTEDGSNLEGNARYWTDITSYRRSLEICNDQIKQNPNDGYAYVNRGGLYFGLGDFDNAFADYDKAIELDPTDIRAYVNRGNAYYMRGDYDKSIADYTYAVTLAPNDEERAKSFYALSVVYAAKSKGDQKQAEQNLNEAIRLNPNGYRGSIAEYHP